MSELTTTIRNSVKTQEVNASVRARDQDTCKFCGAYGRIVHHIKPFMEIVHDNGIETLEQAYACDELWDTENLIVVCYECHRGIHPWMIPHGGRKPHVYTRKPLLDIISIINETIPTGVMKKWDTIPNNLRRCWIGIVYLKCREYGRNNVCLALIIGEYFGIARKSVHDCATFSKSIKNKKFIPHTGGRCVPYFKFTDVAPSEP